MFLELLYPFSNNVNHSALERIKPSTATFDFVAIDFTGVFTVYEGTTPQKCYVMVVADLVTRFVSVEVVSSMSTAAFIEAFRSYAALRSCLRKVFSDRGTNLISGEKGEVLKPVFLLFTGHFVFTISLY